MLGDLSPPKSVLLVNLAVTGNYGLSHINSPLGCALLWLVLWVKSSETENTGNFSSKILLCLKVFTILPWYDEDQWKDNGKVKPKQFIQNSWKLGKAKPTSFSLWSNHFHKKRSSFVPALLRVKLIDYFPIFMVPFLTLFNLAPVWTLIFVNTVV